MKVIVAPEARHEVMADLRARDDGMIIDHASRPRGGEGTSYYLTGQIVVCFHDCVSNEQSDAVFDAEGVRIVKAAYAGARTSWWCGRNAGGGVRGDSRPRVFRACMARGG